MTGRAMRKVALAVAACAALVVFAGSGLAQDKPAKDATAAPAKTAKGAKKGVSDASSGQKVLRLDAIKVEGKIQKPQAYYFLPRSNLNIEGLELNESFVPKIIKSIDEEPF